MRELSEYILSTLLGSFILTWTIHEVYCHSKVMNFSEDVLVYHVLVLLQKKKRKGSFLQGVGVKSTPVLPYSYMYSNATGCLLAGWLVSAYVIGLPLGKKDAGPGGLYNGWSNFRNFPPIRGGGI